MKREENDKNLAAPRELSTKPIEQPRFSTREFLKNFLEVLKMARKYNKTPKALSVSKEDRNLRGIALCIIAFLTMRMPNTLAKKLLAIVFIAVGMKNKKVAMLIECTSKAIKTLSRNRWELRMFAAV